MSTSNGEVTSKVEAVMARIRARSPACSANSPTPAASRFRSGDGFLFPEEVYRSIHQARTIGGGIAIDHTLGWRTPIVGQVWMAIRQRIHQEIRIYIDALTAQQSNVNLHLIRIVTNVVETLDSLGLGAIKGQQIDQATALVDLRSEVRALRLEVEALKSRLGTIDGTIPVVASAERQ
jgi:hypothetical protein